MGAQTAGQSHDWGLWVNEVGILASGIAAGRWIDFTCRVRDGRLTMLWAGLAGCEWHVMCGSREDARDALETFLGVGFHKGHVKVGRLSVHQAKVATQQERLDAMMAAAR